MRSLNAALPVLFASAALLNACSGSSSPTASSVALPDAAAVRRASWINPDAKKGSLLYVSGGSSYYGDVYIYTYPKGKLVGTIANLQFPSGMCVDKKQDVFVTQLDGTREILEYKHGGTTPIATLQDSKEFPIGCSVDPTTGNLAVANELGTYGGGSVSIYIGAAGTGQGPYTDSAFHEIWFCGYDNQGNLFIDGVNTSDEFEFAELPKGTTQFTNIALNQKFRWPGGIQWDGKYVAVGDREGGVIYQTNGAGGQVIGSTKLDGAGIVSQFFIDGKTVIAPNNGTAMFFKYPKGGEPSKTIDGISQPFGAVVSK